MTRRKEFDFYQHVHSVLRERTRSGFIPYHELYAYLGRRYCLKKDQVKELIKSMERSGYLKIKKRGIILIQNSPGRNSFGPEDLGQGTPRKHRRDGRWRCEDRHPDAQECGLLR